MPLAISKARLPEPKPFLHHKRGLRNLLRRLGYAIGIFFRRESIRS